MRFLYFANPNASTNFLYCFMIIEMFILFLIKFVFFNFGSS